jgi:hypothetical protein
MGRFRPLCEVSHKGRYVNFAVMCTNRTYLCTCERLICGALNRGRAATPRLAGGFRHTASGVDDTAFHGSPSGEVPTSHNCRSLHWRYRNRRKPRPGPPAPRSKRRLRPENPCWGLISGRWKTSPCRGPSSGIPLQRHSFPVPGRSEFM